MMLLSECCRLHVLNRPPASWGCFKSEHLFFIHWCSVWLWSHAKCVHVMLLIQLNPYSIFISIMLYIWNTDPNVNPQVKTRWWLCMDVFSLLMRSQARFLCNWNLRTVFACMFGGRPICTHTDYSYCTLMEIVTTTSLNSFLSLFAKLFLHYSP